jgi:site-specific recombinase XerD
MLIKDAIAQFLKWRNFKNTKGSVAGDDLTLRYFGIAMKNCEVELVNLEMILDWLVEFENWKFGQNTIQKKCITLRKFFEFLKMQNINVLDFNLIPTPRHKFVMPRVADDADFEKLLQTIPVEDNHYWHKRNYCFIIMQSQCGARIGEVLALNMGDLNDDKMGATIHTEKSRGRRPFRQLFWRNETKTALEVWLKERTRLIETLEVIDKEALFISFKGAQKKECYGKRLQQSATKDIFRKYSNRAGLSYTINSHSLRHKLGRDLAMQGANNATISSILGHSQLSSSFVYTELFGNDIKEQYDKYLKK